MDVSGIDRYFVRLHIVLLFSQTAPCGGTRVPRYRHRPVQFSGNPSLPSLRPSYSPA